MKRFLALLLSLILTAGILSACGGKNERGDSDDAESILTDDLRGELNDEYKTIFTQNLFKGAGYVVFRGEEIYDGGAGKADKDKNLDNSADVVYHIASISKQFCAAAILRLCEEGRMRLDDTVGKFFPEYTVIKDITIHNLLSMQSGIPDPGRVYDDDGNEVITDGEGVIPDELSADNTAEENLEALRKLVLSMDLLFEQGDRFSYSNTNYVLLALIVEQVTGKRYEDYIRMNFFEPLEMDTAGFSDDYDESKAIVAQGYHSSSLQALSFKGISKGCGDIMASPKDIYKWTVALHGSKVLGDEMYRKMTTAYTSDGVYAPGYGYGLMIGASDDGSDIYYHGGSTPGFRSLAAYLPGQDLYVAVMSNFNCESAEPVAFAMIRATQEKLGLSD